jgi:hypothetical protein
MDKFWPPLLSAKSEDAENSKYLNTGDIMSDKNEVLLEGNVSVHVPYHQGLSPASRLTYRLANSTGPETQAVECDPYVPTKSVPPRFVADCRHKTATDCRYTAPLSIWGHMESGLETFDQEIGRDSIQAANVEILSKFKLTFFFILRC